MKYLFFIYSSIKRIIIHNWLTFLIVMVSMSIATFGILFYCGYLSDTYSDENQQECLIVNLKKEQKKEDIMDLYKKIISNRDIWEVIAAETTEDEENLESTHLSGVYSKEDALFMLMGRTFELDSDEKGVVLTEENIPEELMDTGYIVGKSIQIEGENFSIKGITSGRMNNNVYTAVNNYINNYPTDYFKITFQKELSKSEEKELKKILDNDSVENYSIERKSAFIFSTEFWSEFWFILLIFCVVIINIFMIIIYWIEQQKKEYNIYKICGASDIMIYLFTLLKISCILIFGILIGFILYMSCLGMFAKHELAVLNAGLYVEMTFIIMLIVIAFTAIAIKSSNIKNEIYYISE